MAERPDQFDDPRSWRLNRMAALGRLADGACHQINNSLTAILGCVDLVRAQPCSAAANGDALDNIESAARQAANVSRSLLSYARGDDSAKGVHDGRDSVKAAIELLRHLLPGAIEIVVRLPAEPVWVETGAAAVQQILMSLAADARDAMPDGGRISIALDSASECASAPETTFPNGAARLTVEGQGNCAAHSFPLSGTAALGMPAALAIARASGASISVAAREDGRARIDIALPRAAAGPQLAHGASRQRRGNGELIIVAESDRQVRAIAAAVLAASGYAVIQAADGRETLTALAEHREQVRLMIVDLDLPAENGWKWVEEIRQKNASLPLIVMTGAAWPAVDARHEELCSVLQKPFAVSELTDLVFEAISARVK